MTPVVIQKAHTQVNRSRELVFVRAAVRRPEQRASTTNWYLRYFDVQRARG
jgi:hypothetical protein